MSKLLPMLDPFDEIKKLYFSTTRETIERDLTRALDLLAHMPDDDARQRAAGLMHGLTDLQREWKPKRATPGTGRTAPGPPSRTKDKGQRTKPEGRKPKTRA
jgi:hypothetical protein